MAMSRSARLLCCLLSLNCVTFFFCGQPVPPRFSLLGSQDFAIQFAEAAIAFEDLFFGTGGCCGQSREGGSANVSRLCCIAVKFQ